ncbi:MAG: ribosome maturation factor RimP [Ruminococcaceae bacterium]|nr:ribosome maturation factor RimP [Oscillospiraceae bacterium]
MADKKTNIAAKVRAAVEAVITDAGYSLWDVSYYKEGPEMILEISIDKEEGISINDCSAVTRLVEPIIDELDPIEESYCLQVASAGTVRPLNKDEHIEFACNGELTVNIGLYVAVDGSKEYSGVIVSYDDDYINLDCEGTVRKFEKKQIAKINAEFEAPASEEDTNTKEKEDE